MPISTEPARGIQLKEGSFIFPQHFKCRVDVNALKEIPRKFDICQQGIEALNDLFYEAPPEQKEGVLTQKSIWENVLERIHNMEVFNATSSYTNLSNQLIPLKVLLPDDRQYFPVDPVLAKDPTNPFKETKIFARELFDIVAAIKSLREEPLFQYKEFHIFPSKEAFAVTDSETGRRCLAVGIHSITPSDIEEGLTTEQLSMKAIKELIAERWDRREFRKVTNAQSLDAMFLALKHLSQDVSTLKMISIKSGYAAVYTLIGFLAFSLLMFITGVTPWNKAILEEISLCEVTQEGDILSKVKCYFPPTENTREQKEIFYNRIITDVKKKSLGLYQIVGTYRSPFRLKTMGGLGIFKLLGISTQLDRLYNLNYDKPLERNQFICEPQIKMFSFTAAHNDFTFRAKGLERWGRERFKIYPKDIRKEKAPFLGVELMIMKPKWTIEMNPKSIAFQQAEATGKKRGAGVSTGTINVYANPTQEEKEKGVQVDEAYLKAYFTVKFERRGIPIQIHYLDPKGKAVGKIIFDKFREDKPGKVKSAPQMRAKRDGRRSRDEDEEDEERDEDDDSPRRKKLPKVKKPDTFWLDRNDAVAQMALSEKVITGEQFNECLKIWEDTPGLEMGELLVSKRYVKNSQYKEFKTKLAKLKRSPAKNTVRDTYYRLPKLPKSVNAMKIVVLAKNLPDDPVKGSIHLVVPGIEKPIFVPISFQAKQKVEFSPEKMVDIRDTVTGLAYPIDINKSVWGKKVKFSFHELRYFTFQLQNKYKLPHLKGFGAWSVGVQVKNDPKLYFYNNEDGKSYAITDFSRKSGKIYFAAKTGSYSLARTDIFETQDIKNKNVFGLREAVAKITRQVYIFILTDKNVEGSQLTLKWRGGETAAVLPVSARSREALRIVRWKPESAGRGLARYTKKDWVEKISVNGPLGNERYQAIIFSGEQADKDVSDEVFMHIGKPGLANVLYQTVDGDWFSNIKQSVGNIKLISNPKTQMKILKRPKHKDAYYRAQQMEIGRVHKYLIVPGRDVKTGQKAEKTKIKFFYPEKDMERELEVEISCAKAPAVEWNVTLDNKEKAFKVKIKNFPRAQAKDLAKKLNFLTTCAAISLLHNQYHNNWSASEDDTKWGETIKWSLESVGYQTPPTPPAVLGKLGKTIGMAIEQKSDLPYQITRETLLLGWSPQAQSLLRDQLGLDSIYANLRAGTSAKNPNYTVTVKLQAKRALPPLVNEPERFIEVDLTIPYDRLLLGKTAPNIHQLREAYYYSVPKNFAAVPEVTKMLTELYQYPKAFPKQINTLENSGVKISELLYPNLLQYSLWERRLYDFNKKESKFFLAMQGITTELAGTDGKINKKEANAISEIIQKKLRTYFLAPVEIRRVFWSEVKEKIRSNEAEREKNRDVIGKEEVDGLLRYVDRSTMSQMTEKKAWYTDFTFVIDRMMLDRCPFHKWIYIKTYRPTVEGYKGEEVKFRIFKKDGLNLSPYPGQDYSVNITTNPTGFTKIVHVKGITVYQDWYDKHPSSDIIENKVKNRMKIKFYYKKSGSGREYELKRPGRGGPPMIDFKAHPASVLLYEVSGYHISPDRIRQLARMKDFSLKTTKGKLIWIRTFKFDNGPILVPFVFQVNSIPDRVSYTRHSLKWKQDPLPDMEDRNLISLSKNFNIEFLYVNMDEQLPLSYFFPYRNLGEICKDYDGKKIFSRRMIDLLEKIFKYKEQIRGAKHVVWNMDLGKFYDTTKDKDQMFVYSYKELHELKLNVPATHKVVEGYKGKAHPKLVAPQGSKQAVIWKISPKPGSKLYLQRGFPKYIMEKQYFKNSEPVFSKE